MRGRPFRDWKTRVAAIAGITALDGWALHLGHNGVLLATSMAAIGGIAGWSVRNDRTRAAHADGGGRDG